MSAPRCWQSRGAGARARRQDRPHHDAGTGEVLPRRGSKCWSTPTPSVVCGGGRRSYGRMWRAGEKRAADGGGGAVGVVVVFTPWISRRHAAARSAARSPPLLADPEGLGGAPGSCVDWCAAYRGPPAAGRARSGVRRAGGSLRHLIRCGSCARCRSPARSRSQASRGAGGERRQRTTLELGGIRRRRVRRRRSGEDRRHHRGVQYRIAGQVCISPTRFYVQEPVYDRFLKRFTDFDNNIKLGDGLEEGVTIGPMAVRAARRAREFCQRRQEPRRQDRHRQKRARQPRLLFRADGGDRHSRRLQGDDRGAVRPVCPIVAFKTFDQVVARANSLQFGLAAYAFTSFSTATATAIGDALKSGMVGVNSVAISTPGDAVRRCEGERAMAAKAASKGSRPTR